MPVFSAKFCQTLLEELEHFEQSDMPKGRPNTMNNHGVGEAWPVNLGSGGQLRWEAPLRCCRQAAYPTLSPKTTLKENSFCP